MNDTNFADIDPDTNFFINMNNNCSYYTEEQLNNTIMTEKGLSIIHLNSRSLYANFESLQDLMKQGGLISIWKGMTLTL